MRVELVGFVKPSCLQKHVRAHAANDVWPNCVRSVGESGKYVVLDVSSWLELL